jgi:predicted transcriptional regulator
MTNLAYGTLSHHIKILQRQGRIRVRRDSSSTRLFPKNYDDELCSAIASVSHPTTLAIMALLMSHEYAGYTQIKTALARSASTICGHLRRLLSSGIISRKRVDGVWIYRIKDVDKAAMVLNRDSINKIYAEK